MAYRLRSFLLPPVAIAIVALFATREVRARDTEDYGAWRRAERPFESPQRFALEFRLGPYRPKIDEQWPATRPYATAFGDDNRLFIGLEFDWQILRIPKVGTIGPGLGWQYTHMSARAKLESGEDSAEDTNLAIMPMYAVGVLRVDVLARETAIPLVGYGKAGLGYGLWWTSNDIQTQSKGHTWGTHFALGGMLLLDAFDQHAAVQLDNEWGINNTYFFFEWMFANLDGFGRTSDASVLAIGTSTWVLGLALEM
jgi:hypothetical protein